MHHLPKDNDLGAQSEVPSARVERSPLRVAEFAAAKQQIVANNQNSPVEDACRRTSVKCGAGGYSKVPEGAKMRAPESETQLTRTMPIHGAEAFEQARKQTLLAAWRDQCDTQLTLYKEFQGRYVP